jgi:L-threonylcarbamoyladenylate synthase
MTQIGVDISVAVQLLRDERLVAIPTETVYGLAGNAMSIKAVSEIFQVKNRPYFDPMIIHTDDLSKIENLIHSIPEPLLELAKHFMPGPLTILAPRNSRIPDLVTSGSSKVAIRIPDHPLTLELLGALDFPLAAPSANPFGYISPTTAQHVLDQLEGSIPYILDGGPCTIGLESTIVDFIEGEVTILRKGGIPVEEIEKSIGKVKVISRSSSRPSAPGMLEHHYAPKIPLTIKSIREILPQFSTDKIGYLSFSDKNDLIPDDHQRVLSVSKNLVEAAQHFFSYLRELDQLKLDIIIAELVPEEGLGRAINDKLRRAARS